MNDEHIACLTGWVQGEEILEYIRRIEIENKELNCILEVHIRALEEACELLSAALRSCNVYEDANGYVYKQYTEFKTAEEWKNKFLYGSDS